MSKLLIVTPMHGSLHTGGLAFSCERIAEILARHADVSVVLFDPGLQYKKGVVPPKARTVLRTNGKVRVDYVPPGFSYTGALGCMTVTAPQLTSASRLRPTAR